MSGQRIAHGCRGRDTGVRAPSGMKNPAKTFAQIGVSRARAGTVRARLWHRKGGVRPRYGRCRRFPARSRRADVRTIPDVTSRVHLSRCLVISSPTRKQRLIIAGGLCTYRPPAIETHRRERRRGPAFRAGRYYPRSAREFATCGGSRAPPRCVPPTRLFKSKQKRVRKGDDTGSRWIQTLSYNSRNGGDTFDTFCRLSTRLSYLFTALPVRRTLLREKSGAPFRLRGCPWKFTTHTRDLTVVARRSPSAVRGVNTRVRILRVKVRTAGRREGDAGPAGGEREARGGATIGDCIAAGWRG